MSQMWIKYRQFTILLLFLFLSVLLMTFFGQGHGQRAVLDRIIVEMLSPFHQLASLIVEKIHNVWSGAAFGGRSDTFPAAFISCLLARKAVRPVRMILTREEVEEVGRDRAPCVW